MKQRNHHHTGQDDPQTITKAVTHIRLEAINAGKLAALDELAPVYMALCQQYVTLFCTDEHPDKFQDRLECRQTRRPGNSCQERLYLAGMQRVSLCGPS